MAYIALWGGWLLSVEERWTLSVVEMAEFFGGAAGPIAVVWLIGAYFSQREELAETRAELAKQTTAQEGALRASLAQQVLNRLPVAREVIFQRFWKLVHAPRQNQISYESRDLDFALRNFQISDAHTMYGTDAQRLQECIDRGFVEALDFALTELEGLTQSAKIADPSGALSGLVEQSLSRREISTWVDRLQRWGTAQPVAS